MLRGNVKNFRSQVGIDGFLIESMEDFTTYSELLEGIHLFKCGFAPFALDKPSYYFESSIENTKLTAENLSSFVVALQTFSTIYHLDLTDFKFPSLAGLAGAGAANSGVHILHISKGRLLKDVSEISKMKSLEDVRFDACYLLEDISPLKHVKHVDICDCFRVKDLSFLGENQESIKLCYGHDDTVVSMVSTLEHAREIQITFNFKDYDLMANLDGCKVQNLWLRRTERCWIGGQVVGPSTSPLVPFLPDISSLNFARFDLSLWKNHLLSLRTAKLMECIIPSYECFRFLNYLEISCCTEAHLDFTGVFHRLKWLVLDECVKLVSLIINDS
jgi:hypothetical protein